MQIRLTLVALLLAINSNLWSQTTKNFTGDQSTFKSELTQFMGPNLTESQKLIFNSFINKWDSLEISNDIRNSIINISSQMVARNMRPAPGFILYLNAVDKFTDSDDGWKYFEDWLKGLSETIFNPRYNNTALDKYLETSALLISENCLYKSNSVRWSIYDGDFTFTHDTVFKVNIADATLVCYSQNDSTVILNARGVYYPENYEFRGEKGRVTWEKAGYSVEEMNADINRYTVDATRNLITADSAILFHHQYFPQTILGKLTDQAARISSPDRAIFPKFETYTKKFRIDNLYQDVNYEGGLSFEGASVRGTGENYFPALISLFRNDTLYIEVRSKSFLLNKNSVNSQEVNLTLFLEKDSIFHSNLGFQYLVETREVNFFRTSSPVSRSPYFNSFHNLDMYFEYLSWDMDEPLIRMSRLRGSSIGQASFESFSFFRSDIFERMLYFDDVHPLYNLKRFAEYFYSESFPVAEYAKWMNKPVETVTAQCIDLANKGFLFYDRTIDEVTIKPKVDDFINSYARKKDYDVISIFSEVGAPMDNALLDLKNYNITINGVQSVFLSDSQRVAIFPYENKIIVEKNRNFRFDGVVVAGLFTIFGHEFSFNYDTFKIDLSKIDSIRIAVESTERDNLGNPVIEEIDNLIQLGTAELFIDAPNNKSGRRSLQQYPIINATTYSYIFFDRIPGLEGVYPQSDYYFKVDPFSYENIDHYMSRDLNLTGEFNGGKVLKPMPQTLIIQDDNSLGFSMNIPSDGLSLYDGKGTLFDFISMSNQGLVGKGRMARLSGITYAEEFMFYPDSMITVASEFAITASADLKYPDLKASDVDIKWITGNDEWFAFNKEGKEFDMYSNNTRLDGYINQTPAGMKGGGVIDRPDARLTSDYLSFTAGIITADSSDYALKPISGEGIAFLAENTVTTIDFPQQETRFRLNSEDSMVKFPEIEFICTMSDFLYDMESQVLNMEQKDISSTTLTPAEELLKINRDNLERPTFYSTNNLRDTLRFASSKGFYYLKEETVEAGGINYIPVADALIQPSEGKIEIGKRAVIKPMRNATIAINNRHIIHSASIDIASARSYTGSGVYNYTDEEGNISPITFSEIRVDTLTTNASGYISATQNFLLSPYFSFIGDVSLTARRDNLTFTGGSGIIHNCSNIESLPVKFKSEINPLAVMIPVTEKSRDMNDNMVFSSSFLNTDSIHIYPAFLSPRKSWSDTPLITADGFLFFDKAVGSYRIASLAKLTDNSIPGNMVTFDKNFCVLTGEGKISFGTDYDLLTMANAGRTFHNTDSSRLTVQTFLALDFYFSNQALTIMSDEIRLNPSLRPVNLNTDFNRKSLADILGEKASKTISDELGTFGVIRSMPPEFTYELFLNDVTLEWNEATSSFRSVGKIGIGFIGQQPVNLYVDGHIEIQRRRSGDLLDIYLKADESTWYYFSYFRGVMMTLSGNSSYNTLITETKLKDRKDPKSSGRLPFTYMISLEDRFRNFLRRMSSRDLLEDTDY
ncbi:MAG: hypothetical protein IH591_15715 [Bacteroidales bacterium]|nr:hypothetical protein [Bacteroidales bacterium]